MLETDLIFVYGTLQNGFSNRFSRILTAKSQFIGSGTIRGKLYDLGEYPGACESKEEVFVHGELYRSIDLGRIIPILDYYEGDEYVRKISEVDVNGNNYQAYVYFFIMPVEEVRVIKSGNYKVFKGVN